jgi:hypothetical protein
MLSIPEEVIAGFFIVTVLRVNSISDGFFGFKAMIALFSLSTMQS